MLFLLAPYCFYFISNVILHSSLFLLHFAIVLACFIYIVTFIFSLSLPVSIPYFYYLFSLSNSFFYLLVILYSFFLSYSLFTFTNFCSFALDIADIVGGYFCWQGLGFLGSFALFCQHLYNSIQDVVGVVTLYQPVRGENPPMNELCIVKAQVQQESPHKPNNGHPQSIQIRRSKRLHPWVPQNSHHRRPPHKDRQWK